MCGSSGIGGRLRSGLPWLLMLALAACDDIPGLKTGNIEVTVATTGADPPDGYSLSLDGATGLALAVNATKALNGLSAGSHSVQLTGLAANCTVAGDNPRSVDVLGDLTTPVAFSVACVAYKGSIAVSVSTSGVELDPDGYMVRVDGGAGEYAPLSAALIFNGVVAGTRSVSLDGVAPNCTVAPGNPLSVVVVAGSTVQVAFAVTCHATVGSLVVTVGTTGADLDPDGYTMSVDGAAALRVAVNGQLTISGIKGGTHTALLADLAANCAAGGPNPRSIDIIAGDTVRTAFAVVCSATTGTVRVTTSTTGVDLPSGYTVTLDGAGGQAVAVNGTVVIAKVLGGGHSVGLTGIPSNCTASGANPRNVTVPIGDTITAAFALQCVRADRIAFVSNGDIDVMTADGSAVAQLTTDPAPDISPSWSPDGTRLAFVSYRDRFAEIYVMNADGSNQVRLTSVLANHWDPAWSPDGSKIAFASNRDGNAEIYVMGADGSNVTRLTNNAASDAQPAWSPDGTRIAFQSYRDGNSEIYAMNADGSGVVRLTNNPATDAEPAWSPDGSKIAFVSDRDGNYQIYVMNADGSAATRLISNQDVDLDPAWSPSGSTLAFTGIVTSCDYYYCDSYSTIYLIKADGSGLRALWFSGYDSEPAWRP